MLDSSGDIYNAAFSLNTRLLAVARERLNHAGGTISILDATTGQCRQTIYGHRKFVTDIVFACDSQLVATASADRTVRIWDATMWLPRQTLSHSDYLTKLRFSPGNDLIAAASLDRTVQLWSSTTGMHLQSFCYDKGLVHEISLSENELVVSVSDDDWEVRWSPWRSMALKVHTYGIAAQQTVTPNLAVRGLGLDADQTWITKDSERIVWLPPEYRPNRRQAWARSESMIFIGHRSDQPIRFRIS
ncbi:hypothetical protein PFICI_11230 [Pestalotiopsis fici W106-1]|uniref:Uncharacterized protein n=1 Tax=Pestalotiopsis fici (strain W106-1 / CGMCC3.15140) TaxID=1229662 RepID=W3WWV8_PESFW|nr:uncharacterized protein PFICI_11230 [Pestalotiopsis fici W106-1]ETS77356.1 hypothetical protein PFICI_11230 [Pestalotiopsis fici W106-1]